MSLLKLLWGLINGEGLIYTYLGDPRAGLMMMF